MDFAAKIETCARYRRGVEVEPGGFGGHGSIGNRRLFDIARACRGGGTLKRGCPRRAEGRHERRRPGIARLRYYIPRLPRTSRKLSSRTRPLSRSRAIGLPVPLVLASTRGPYFKRVSIAHRLTRHPIKLSRGENGAGRGQAE